MYHKTKIMNGTMIQYFHWYTEGNGKLWELRPYNKAIRLLGLSLSNLNTEEKKQISVQLKIPFEEF